MSELLITPKTLNADILYKKSVEKLYQEQASKPRNWHLFKDLPKVKLVQKINEQEEKRDKDFKKLINESMNSERQALKVQE